MFCITAALPMGRAAAGPATHTKVPCFAAAAAVTLAVVVADVLRAIAPAVLLLASAAGGGSSSSTPLLVAVAMRPTTSMARTLTKMDEPAGAATLALKMLVETPTLVQPSTSVAPGEEPTAQS